MNPVRFGSAERQMFGIHHPPVSESRHEGVLLCNPFGQEAIRSHRLFRVLADQLARQGFHVLRFDYFGTGDSAGEDGEGEMEGWGRDILSADEELRRGCHCSRISWFGLRLGASMAALASRSSSTPLNCLLLWDPVVDGSWYMKELAAGHIDAARDAFGARWSFDQKLRDAAMTATESEALGFALTPELRKQLGLLSAQRLATAEAKSIALLAAPELPELAKLQKQLEYFGKPLSTHLVENKINWLSNEAMGSSIAPVELLKTVVSLLGDGK
ncbi:hypothetical protein BH11PSE11_BH11PSE11_02610 [soil metagenome]